MDKMDHVIDMDDVAPLLRKLRLESGESLRDVAAGAEVNPDSLFTWEKGQHKPLMNNFLKLMKYYGATVTIGWPPQQGGEST